MLWLTKIELRSKKIIFAGRIGGESLVFCNFDEDEQRD